MLVYILDLDWIYDKSELPNIDCMKLSSFCKQKGHDVYFVNNIDELKMPYDKVYIFGNSDSTPFLGSKILNDKRTTLFGKKFELCGAKSLGPVIMGCRPDYLLYDIPSKESTIYNRANFITFYTDRGESISKRQAWKNTKKGVKKTIVTDEVLWEQNPEEVIKCFEELKNENNIMFLNPISLRYLIQNKEVKREFFSLNFSRGAKFKWRNDMGSDEKSAEEISNFILEFKKHTKSNVGAIPILGGVGGDYSLKNNLERLIKVIAVFKRNKIKCFVPLPNSYPPELEWINNWCTKGFENSFIEEMVFFSAAKKGKRWFDIINDPSLWGDNKVKFIIQLLADKKWREFLPQMSVQWGQNGIDYSRINFKIIDQRATALI